MVSIVSNNVLRNLGEVETQEDQRDLEQGFERHQPDRPCAIPYVFPRGNGQASAFYRYFCWYVAHSFAT